jgi:hypothetical protein
MMPPRFHSGLAVASLLLAAGPLFAQPAWQEEFAKMPLTEKAPELNRHNCVPLMLDSFRRNPAAQALIFMPGATDEFYFFRRACAALTNASPTLLDAISALTNQTHIQATLRPPFLILHTAEDPLEPLAAVEDQRTADRIKKKKFEKHAVFNDCDWDFVQPILAFDLDTHISPGLRTHESYHFFRHSLAAFDLNGWDALRAVALAGKTKFTVKKKRVVFEGDLRYLARPANLTPDFLLNKNGEGR